jgi:hypothetical protein
MKTKLFLLFLVSFIFCTGEAQIPQGFNYQAVARDPVSGNPIVNTPMPVRLTIQTETADTTFWQEEHSSVITNSFGLINVIVGKGVRKAGTAATFSAIDWSKGSKFIKTEIDYGGWKTMGTSQLWSVPYTMIAGDIKSPIKKLTVKGTTSDMDEALFEVKNNIGQTIFAVYNEGVRVYVDDGKKGIRGGFAVGGFGDEKGVSQKYLAVSADSIRMYIDDQGKGIRGGFAVGGFDQSKTGNANFLNVATDAGGIVNPAQNRVLWYPMLDKNAFLVGRVLIQHPDSIGVNSVTTGYESRAKGMYSQAFGFQSIARGNYSTAIGKNALAHKDNSFAFGDKARASGISSYAFGTGAKASGEKSFALGSVGVDSLGNPTGPTIASGYAAFALGFGSVASGWGAFTLGVIDTASGPFALAMGYNTKSESLFSTTLGWGTTVELFGINGLATGAFTKAGNYAAAAFGDHTYASGHTSFATGFETTAAGHLSSTFGLQTTANGSNSIAMGDNTTAQAYGSFVLGRYNVVSGTPGIWNNAEPAFVIGNGTSASSRSNAVTIYKNGSADFGGSINLNKNSTYGAVYVNSKQAVWFDGNYFSWGYDGLYNVFAHPVSVGTTANPGSYSLYVVGTTHCTGGTWTDSDIRWKKNISDLDNVLDKALQLKSVSYSWKQEEFPEKRFDSGTQIGLIAQDVEKVFPELVRTDDNGYKAVSYEKLSVVLLEGMKEQQHEIETTKKENLELKSELQSLKEEIEKIRILMTKVASN